VVRSHPIRLLIGETFATFAAAAPEDHRDCCSEFEPSLRHFVQFDSKRRGVKDYNAAAAVSGGFEIAD